MTKTTAVSLIAALLGAALCGSGTAASAQAASAEKPITIKLGAFLPSGSDLKNAVGKTWFSAGAEYALMHGGSGGAAQTLAPLAYVDYAENSSHGVRADYVGVGPGIRYDLAAPGSSTLIPYVGAGVGAYFLHASGFGSSDNKTRFGYRLNAGVEFSRAYLFEINYTDPGSLSGANFGGFNIQVGAKF